MPPVGVPCKLSFGRGLVLPVVYPSTSTNAARFSRDEFNPASCSSGRIPSGTFSALTVTRVCVGEAHAV